jgi:glutamine phosphoribosylpyrophosphate amidotransferase
MTSCELLQKENNKLRHILREMSDAVDIIEAFSDKVCEEELSETTKALLKMVDGEVQGDDTVFLTHDDLWEVCDDIGLLLFIIGKLKHELRN